MLFPAVASLTALAVLAWPLAASAERVVLRYQGANRWVAPADNAGLRLLFRQVAQGRDSFQVVLPVSARPLSEARLQVLLGLLEEHGRGQPVMLQETSGQTAPNTLTVSW